MLITIEPEDVNSIDKAEWEFVKFAVDSGATETAVGENMLTSIEMKEGEARKRGVKYEVPT